MIYIDIYHGTVGSIENTMTEVKITYPNEEDFMKEREVQVITPHNGSIRYERGIYQGGAKGGYLNNVLEVEGWDETAQEHVIIALPISSCTVKKHLKSSST
jgi:hypothetical protein